MQHLQHQTPLEITIIKTISHAILSCTTNFLMFTNKETKLSRQQIYYSPPYLIGNVQDNQINEIGILKCFVYWNQFMLGQ